MFLHFKDAGTPYDPIADIKTVACALVAFTEVDGCKLAEVTKLSPLRINRAVAYLEDNGMASVVRVLGTAPFDFREVISRSETRRFVAENCK